MAVPFFMLVSGYVYTKSFQKNGIETLDSAYNKKYLLKNLIRYTIPYFIAFMIDFCVQVFLYIRNPTVMKRFFVHEIALFLQGGNGPGSYYYVTVKTPTPKKQNESNVKYMPWRKLWHEHFTQMKKKQSTWRCGKRAA